MRQSRDLDALCRFGIDPGQCIYSKHLRGFFDTFPIKLWIAKPWLTNDQQIFNVFNNTFSVYFSSVHVVFFISIKPISI